MMKVDPLQLLLIIEAALLTSILASILFLRVKKHKKFLMHVNVKREELINLYSDELQLIKKKLEEFKKNSGDGEEEKIGIAFQSSRVNFLSFLVEGLKKSEYNEGTLCNAIFKRFDGINHQFFEEIKSLSSENKSLEVLSVKQKKQIGELSSYKDMLTDLQGKFEKIKNSNEKLKKSINSLIPEAERSKDLEEMLEEFERSQRDFDNCLGTLETENGRMVQAIEKYEEEIDGLSDMADEYNNILVEKDGLMKKLSQKESELKQAASAYELLQNNFNTLEAEYKRLYDETKHDEE